MDLHRWEPGERLLAVGKVFHMISTFSVTG